MDAATAIKVGKTAIKVAKEMKKLYDIDQRKRVIINKDFYAGTFREKVMINGTERVVPDFKNDDFEIVDRRMIIFKTGDRDPFCDGSSFSPEQLGSINLLKPAIGHDAIFQYLEDIAKAWGWTEDEVMELANAMHGNGLEHEAERQTNAAMRMLGYVVSRVAYAATRTFGGIYHRTHAGRNAVVAALVLFVAGCAEIPQVFDPSDEEPDVTITTASAISSPAEAGTVPDGFFDSFFPQGTSAGEDSSAETPAAAEEKPAEPAQDADAVDFSALRWEYGGFRGGKATLADCRIKDLKVSRSGLSYAWEKGGCEDLDRACTHDNAVCTCALFCRVDGKWIGGKFDHISTDRRTRGFENIEEGYGGWDASLLSRADAFAFLIEDDGGRRRTNVITCGR